MSHFRSSSLALSLMVVAGALVGCFGNSGGGSGSDGSISPPPEEGVQHKRLYFSSRKSSPTYRACGYINLQTNAVYELTATSLINTFDVCTDYTYANGIVTFKGSATGNEYQLFFHDIEADTVAQASINTGGSSDPYGFVVLGDDIYFNATTSTNGSELWMFDTATKSASLVSDLRPGSASSSANSLYAYQGKLYLAANNGTQGVEPFVYDPVANTTTMLSDVYSGATGSSPADFVGVGGKVYFTAVSATHGRELYVYDPAIPSVTRLTDINTSGNGLTNYTMIAEGSNLYFAATDGSDGIEPYRYDTNSNSVSRLADLNSGSGSSAPSSFKAFNNKIYFAANDGVIGLELYVYDPAVPSVTVAMDFDGAATDGMGSVMQVMGNHLIVSGTSSAHGSELYKVDNSGVVSRITDIFENSGDSILNGGNCFAHYDGSIYHQAYSSGIASSLYKTNASSITTSVFQPFVDANLGQDPCALKVVEHTEN